MDITLEDLLILEPRLTVFSRAAEADSMYRVNQDAEISWAVSARTMAPHLPILRGRELVLISERVASELGSELAALMREAQNRMVSAFVLAKGSALFKSGTPVPLDAQILEWNGDLAGDTEMLLNRLLTECRGELYRVGSDLERQIADLAVSRSGVTAFVNMAAKASGLPITILDANRRSMASSLDQEESTIHSGEKGPHFEVKRDLSGHALLVLRPLRNEQHVTARFLAGRIAAAAEMAMKRDEAARPRGPRRVEATEALLSGQRFSASEQRSAALALDLDPDAVYFVAVSHGENETGLARALAPLGAVHPAGGANRQRSTLVATIGRAAATSLSHRVGEVKRRWEIDHATDGATLAFSAPAFGVASLPAAAREAEFLAMLQRKSACAKRAASFESVDDLGALRLLYQLRDSSELRHFVKEALGTLENRDQRGTLRVTLRAFLESGGSQVDASHRLGIHRNTLAYRLRRIGELVGRDVGDPGSWLTLHLALRASEMLEVYANER